MFPVVRAQRCNYATLLAGRDCVIYDMKNPGDATRGRLYSDLSQLGLDSVFTLMWELWFGDETQESKQPQPDRKGNGILTSIIA